MPADRRVPGYMPPAGLRVALHSMLAAVTVATIVPTVALAQFDRGPTDSSQLAPVLELFFSGIGAGVATLVIGGLLILLAPHLTRRVTDRAIDEPVVAFLWGFGVTVLVIVVAVGLAITVIGVVIAIPLLLAFGLFALVTAEFGFLATGRLASDDWTVVLIVAVLVAVVAGFVPLLGGLLSFVIGSIGIGAAIVEYRDG